MSLRLRTFLSSLLCCALLGVSPTSFAEPAIVLEQAWIAESPPLSKVMAAYMDIHNPATHGIEINSVSSADFSSIEIHRSVEENGVARMLRQTGISIAAQSRFELQPGGYHLMLFNPKKPFKAGATSQLIFTLADGTTAAFDVPVKKATGHDDHGHHGHH